MSEASSPHDLSGFDTKKPVDELTMLMSQVETFTTAVVPNLPEHLLAKVVDALHARGALEEHGGAVDYDADYDMRNEMEMMLSACRAMRNHVLDGDRVREGIAFRDLKDFMSSVSSMMTTMMKNHEKLMTMDRHRALEQATIQVLKELGGEELTDRFISLMAARLDE